MHRTVPWLTKALHPLPESVAYITGSVSFIADALELEPELEPGLELEIRAMSIRGCISSLDLLALC